MALSLEEMISRWEKTAKGAATYDLTLDDWLNDLDLREMIARQTSEGAVVSASAKSRLDEADRAFRESTIEAKGSMWGPTAGREHHPTAHWWYFRYPSSPGSYMRRDLIAAGVLQRPAH